MADCAAAIYVFSTADTLCSISGASPTGVTDIASSDTSGPMGSSLVARSWLDSVLAKAAKTSNDDHGGANVDENVEECRRNSVAVGGLYAFSMDAGSLGKLGLPQDSISSLQRDFCLIKLLRVNYLVFTI